MRRWLYHFSGNSTGNEVNYHPETPKKAPLYIFDIILMAMQFYAYGYGSLFTPEYPDYLYDRRWRGTCWSRGVTNVASHAFVSRLQSAHKADCRRRGGLSNFGTFWKQGLSRGQVGYENSTSSASAGLRLTLCLTQLCSFMTLKCYIYAKYLSGLYNDCSRVQKCENHHNYQVWTYYEARSQTNSASLGPYRDFQCKAYLTLS